MKIYFCDICNESIPLQDLETGAAITVKGKVICRTCNPAAGSRATSAPGGGGRAVGFALLAFLGAAAASVGYTRYREKELDQRLRGEADAVRGDLAPRFDVLDRRVAAADDRVVGADRRIGELSQAFEEGQRLGEKEREELRSRFDRVQGYIKENEDLKHRLERLEIRSTALDEGNARLAGAVEGLRAELKEAGAASVAAAVPASGPASPPGEKREEGIPPAIQALIDRLKDKDASVRWAAVSDLAQSGNPKVVPFLVPLLKDEDDFVRHNAALTLGELDARGAVPALLDSLGDSNAIVRDSAITALRRITRQNIKFDPHGSKEERDRALRAWRQWWQASSDKFLNG
ncbi:MAG TPA: HEAT repeat domain-containing protein [Planctomycetota bacterium]|nr:HEAT repeat domain-containing protein [Planctomycetota bacterium]